MKRRSFTPLRKTGRWTPDSSVTALAKALGNPSAEGGVGDRQTGRLKYTSFPRSPLSHKTGTNWFWVLRSSTEKKKKKNTNTVNFLDLKCGQVGDQRNNTDRKDSSKKLLHSLHTGTNEVVYARNCHDRPQLSLHATPWVLLTFSTLLRCVFMWSMSVSPSWESTVTLCSSSNQIR